MFFLVKKGTIEILNLAPNLPRYSTPYTRRFVYIYIPKKSQNPLVNLTNSQPAYQSLTTPSLSSPLTSLLSVLFSRSVLSSTIPIGLATMAYWAFLTNPSNHHLTTPSPLLFSRSVLSSTIPIGLATMAYWAFLTNPSNHHLTTPLPLLFSSLVVCCPPPSLSALPLWLTGRSALLLKC